MGGQCGAIADGRPEPVGCESSSSGIGVAVLAAYRGMQPDEKVPLPALPLAVIVLGIVATGSPFLLGDGVGSAFGISLIVSGLVFIVVPAAMIDQMIDEQHAAAS